MYRWSPDFAAIVEALSLPEAVLNIALYIAAGSIKTSAGRMSEQKPVSNTG